MIYPTRQRWRASALLFAAVSLVAGCTESADRSSPETPNPEDTAVAVAVAPLDSGAGQANGEQPEEVGDPGQGESAAEGGDRRAPFQPCGIYRRAAVDTPVQPGVVTELRATSGDDRRMDNFRYRDNPEHPQWYLVRHPEETPGDLILDIVDATSTDVSSSVQLQPSSGASFGSVFAVDDASGDVFVVETAGGSATLVRATLSGELVWSRPLSGPLVGSVYVFGAQEDAEARGQQQAVGVVVADGARRYSQVFTVDGRPLPDNDIAGSDVRVARSSGGQIVSVEDGGVVIYDPVGSTVTFHMDNSLEGEAAWDLRIDGADLLADGTIVATSANTRTMAFFSPLGEVLATVGGDTNAGEPLDYMNERSFVEVVDGDVVYNAGPPFAGSNRLVAVSADDVTRFTTTAAGSVEHLGLGAALTSGVSHNHFAAGTAPSAHLLLSDWWRSVVGGLDASYTVRSVHEIQAGVEPDVIEVSLPGEADADRSADGFTEIPLTDLPSAPGAYDVSMTFRRNGRVVGADCLHYSVGAPGLGLDLAAIEAERGDVRGVMLADALGQKLFRSNYGFDDCLEGVDHVDADTAPACPAAMKDDVADAVAMAAEFGVTFEMQLGEGGPLEIEAIENGQWSRLVAEISQQLPTVPVWECWNEPNNNTFDSMGEYLRTALAPCHDGVKAAQPDDLVVGGSLLGVSLDEWDDLIEAGGLSYLDIAATHPYTGHNRSYEEQGLVRPDAEGTGVKPGALDRLVEHLRDAGFTGEIFATESGFWNEGPGSYYSQGDKFVRAAILQRSVGIERADNFYDEGEYKVDGLRWGLLTDVVTPGGLAAATFGSVIGDVPFAGWTATGVPHTYAARFGDPAARSLTAVWTDDLRMPIVVSSGSGAPIAVTDEYGATSSLESGGAMMASGSVQYLEAPGGVTVSAATPFGPNLTRTAGVKAEGSSSLECDGVTLGAGRAIDGRWDADDAGGNCDNDGMSVWEPAELGEEASWTVTLPKPESVGRVLVMGKGLGSIEVGLRDFAVDVLGADGTFVEVAHVSNAFFDRAHLVEFSPTTTTAVRLRVLGLNYSGYTDGSKPPFWTDDTRAVSGIYEVELYG